jgi:hypothetical protein
MTSNYRTLALIIGILAILMLMQVDGPPEQCPLPIRTNATPVGGFSVTR